MNFPRQNKAQHLGKEAESYVCNLLTEFGAIYHNIESGNDFGIDGRVELVKNEEVHGEEFFVQVKGTNDLKINNDRVYIKPIRIETAIYWHSKLNPTLLLVFNKKDRQIYYAWVHDAVDSSTLGDAIKKSKKSFAPVIYSKNILNKDTWQEIEKEVSKLYNNVVTAIYNKRAQDDAMVLYKSVSDGLDILIDWLIAPCLNSSTLKPLLSPKAIEIASSHITDKDLYKPPTVQIATTILLYRTLILYTIMVDNSSDTVARTHPLYRISKYTAELIRSYYLDAYSQDDATYRHYAEIALIGDGKTPKLVTLNTNLESLKKSISLITIVSRDYLRTLKPFLFKPPPKTDIINPMMWLDDVSQQNVLTLTEWSNENEKIKSNSA